MAREEASRKWQITINNPLDHGLPHEQIKTNLSELKSIEYWCMCDEIGEEGTPHTHIYIYAKNAIMFSSLKKRFYEAHLEKCKGTSLENRDYIRKEGKHSESKKKETNIIDTFEEWGEMPVERTSSLKQSEEICEMIKEGYSNYEILERFPSSMNRLQHIEKTRQTYLEEKYKSEFRKLEVVYISGIAGVGKTRFVMDKYGYDKVYRVNKYNNPFDNYKGEEVILFDEFHSQIPITEMLNYTDGYPCLLPCRYQDKTACYTKVYIISNIDLNAQYSEIQKTDRETWKAFLRRITEIRVIDKDGNTNTIEKEIYA